MGRPEETHENTATDLDRFEPSRQTGYRVSCEIRILSIQNTAMITAPVQPAEGCIYQILFLSEHIY